MITELQNALQSSMQSAQLLSLALNLGIALVGYLIARYVLLSYLMRAITRTRPVWADLLRESRALHYLTYLVPVVLLANRLATYTGSLLGAASFLYELALIAAIVLGVLAANAGINAALAVYDTYPMAKTVPLTGLGQIAKVSLFVLAAFLLLSLLLNIPVIYFLAALAAVAAAVSFVFRDPILGFFAGIQLAANKMIAIGDWIEMAEFGADGFVREINVTTVKVRNWDNTVTTIPTYAMVSRSFKNWRAMQQSAGRRIRRAIIIDQRSIKPCDQEVAQACGHLAGVAPLLADQENEAKPPTNLALFRAHAAAYLRNHPSINADLMLLVRHLAPTEYGLPVEIYAFSREKDFVPYEALQASILEYLLTVLPTFQLQAYQAAAGKDLEALAGRLP